MDLTAWKRPPFKWGPALLLLAGLESTALLLAELVRGALPALGREVYFMYFAGGFAVWLSLPLAALLGLNALRLGLRSPRLWLCFSASFIAWVLFTHAVGGALYQMLASVFSLPAASLSFGESIRLESNKDLVTFAWLSAAWGAWGLTQDYRIAGNQRVELEAKLAESRLNALSAQLNPHFFFNAMNTVSALMYEDLARTERLIQDLGEMLRCTLSSGKPTWSLAEERAHAERFVGLLEARFGDRLTVHWNLPFDLNDAQVPRFALQVLIENSVKHNEASIHPLRIEVMVARNDALLTLTVNDDGRGFSPEPRDGLEAGTGLRRLSEILRLMHGQRAALRRQAVPTGGASVVLEFPHEVAA